MRLIDADKLVIQLAHNRRRGQDNEEWELAVNSDITIVDKAPVIEIRPKGHWIVDGHHVQCSSCGMYMCNADREGDRIPLNFCPNCGADMSEVTE